MLEFTGYLSAMLFGLCGIPQSIKAYRTGSVRDFSWAFLLMWWSGEICATIYVAGTNANSGEWQIPLLLNYSLNFVIVCYLLWIKCGEFNKKEI